MHIYHLYYIHIKHLFINPSIRMRSICIKTFTEPKPDFSFSTLDRIGSVADISAYIDCEVAANSAGSRISCVLGEKVESKMRHEYWLFYMD